jgi:serine/threonine-protein kinase RsbW
VLEFNSDIQNVSKVEVLVNRVFTENSICEDNYGKILVALTEAVNNAILHGNGLDPGKMVRVSYYPSDSMIYFNISDEGSGFDPEGLPDPTDPENLEKPNGRGVFLMKSLADEITFLNSGREVKLGFRKDGVAA